MSDKNLKYGNYEFKNSASLVKLYLSLKIYRRFFDVPGRPVISNVGAATERRKSKYLLAI